VCCVSEFGTNLLAFRDIAFVGTFWRIIRCNDGPLGQNLKLYQHANGDIGEGRDQSTEGEKEK
jgi:hypothetical protein